jgi:hypothetical protein
MKLYTVYKIWNGTRKVHVKDVDWSEAVQYVESLERAKIIAWYVDNANPDKHLTYPEK